jgi:quinohemoprotein amine dehydrogenase
MSAKLRSGVTKATRALAVVATLLATSLAGVVFSQQPPAAAPTAKPDEGIPVTDATVQKACGTCHRPDDKGQMSRISFQRNTPEGWQSTIQRMAALNGLSIDPATARDVVKYLANNHGLAPE